MSDNYKTIAQARDIAKELLKNPSTSKTAIMKDMGVALALYNDIMENDPVTITIRSKTNEKLKAFIAKHEAVLDPEPAPRGVNREGKDDPFPVVPKKPDPMPERSPYAFDPLAELDALEKKFISRGYKLEARIIKIHQ